ncbi:MAG: hypothetical protein C4339_00070 [Nitrososphaerota archaeon]
MIAPLQRGYHHLKVIDLLDELIQEDRSPASDPPSSELYGAGHIAKAVDQKLYVEQLRLLKRAGRLAAQAERPYQARHSLLGPGADAYDVRVGHIAEAELLAAAQAREGLDQLDELGHDAKGQRAKGHEHGPLPHVARDIPERLLYVIRGQLAL